MSEEGKGVNINTMELEPRGVNIATMKLESNANDDLLKALVETTKVVRDLFHKLHEQNHRVIHSINHCDPYYHSDVRKDEPPYKDKVTCEVCGYE